MGCLDPGDMSFALAAGGMGVLPVQRAAAERKTQPLSFWTSDLVVKRLDLLWLLASEYRAKGGCNLVSEALV